MNIYIKKTPRQRLYFNIDDQRGVRFIKFTNSLITDGIQFVLCGVKMRKKKNTIQINRLSYVFCDSVNIQTTKNTHSYDVLIKTNKNILTQN